MFSLFGWYRPDWNGLNFRRRVTLGGHNNTKLNPVFRGMVRRLMARISNKRK